MHAAYVEAGIPPEAFALYPGGAEAGAALLGSCDGEDATSGYGGIIRCKAVKGYPAGKS